MFNDKGGIMLDKHSQETLDKRATLGLKMLRDAWGTELDGEDFESAAKDAISDVLTAVFGPAGTLNLSDRRSGRAKVELNSQSVEGATALMVRALDSYFGDAEDYVEDEAPKPTADIVIVRDPDASNDISLFGVEANVIDINLGSMDLGDPVEWDEWQQSRKEDFDSVATKDAQRFIAEAVANAAADCGHEVPEWAQ